MNVFLERVSNGIYQHFCKHYGTSFAKINRLKIDFFKHVNFKELEHYGLQMHEFYVFNGSHELGINWKSCEGYFVDWSHSYQFQDLDLLQHILETIEAQIKKIKTFGGFELDLYSKYSNECRFIVRVLYRKTEEEKPKNPDISHQELLLKSLDILKEGLEKDRLNRARNQQVRLNHFTSCSSIQHELSRKCFRSMVIKLVIFSLMFFSYKKLRNK